MVPMSVRSELSRALRQRQQKLVGKLLRVSGLSTDADVQVYRQMRDDNHAAPPLYQAGDFWQTINRDYADLIHAGALRNVRNEYFNRRFAGPDPQDRSVYCAMLWLYYQRVASLDECGLLARHPEPSEGGTGDQVSINGQLMSLDYLQSVEEAYHIKRAWTLAGKPGDPRVIAELGAGYGRLGYVCRKLFPECTYVIFDLPEALICAHSWLSRVLPGEVARYEDARNIKRLDRATLESKRVWLVGPQAIEGVANDALDAFVNIYSFAEMPPSSIANYFHHIDRTVRGVFYTKQRGEEHNTQDDATIRHRDYPVPPRWRELFDEPSILYMNFFHAAYAMQP
jgi:putative sugar O-methyltransferase